MGATAGIPGIGRAMQAGRGVAPVPTGIPPPMPGGMPPRGVPPMPPGLMGPGRGGKFLNFFIKKLNKQWLFWYFILVGLPGQAQMTPQMPMPPRGMVPPPLIPPPVRMPPGPPPPH